MYAKVLRCNQNVDDIIYYSSLVPHAASGMLIKMLILFGDGNEGT